VFDLSTLCRDLSLRGQLAGFEVFERFYEIGSPAGLSELERYLQSTAEPAILRPQTVS
jgi:hypothetical protein